MTEPLDAPHVGSVLGERYELVRHIARGGMGDVYEARDTLLDRPAAVKVYRGAAEGRSRFESEVRVLAQLSHPGLIQVYDVGSHGDDGFVVLELVDGEPLTCDPGGCRPDVVASIGKEAAEALAYVHSNGIVHRDVTPSNVLRDRSGRVRLVDFGIVRLLDQPRVTSASIALGTPAYMAPEQVRGDDVTPAADVYSLGLVLLELLTARREFQGTVQEMVIARLARDPDTSTGVPPSWQPVLRAMLHRDPARRPGAADVARRLDALIADDGAVTAAVTAAAMVPAFSPDPPAAGPARHRSVRGEGRSPHRRPLALFATAVAAAIVGLIVVSGLGDRQPLTPAADAGTSTSAASSGTEGTGPRSVRRDRPTDTSAPDDATVTSAAPEAERPPTASGGADTDPLQHLQPRRTTPSSTTTSTVAPSTTTTAGPTTTAPTTDTTSDASAPTPEQVAG